MKIKDKIFNSNQLWFTSDNHFFHENIIKYCNRPFDSKFLMNKTIIENWNSKIKPNDTVFHLGDFALTAKPKEIDILLNELNGVKHLIIGNHEKMHYKKSILETSGKVYMI